MIRLSLLHQFCSTLKGVLCLHHLRRTVVLRSPSHRVMMIVTQRPSPLLSLSELCLRLLLNLRRVLMTDRDQALALHPHPGSLKDWNPSLVMFRAQLAEIQGSFQSGTNRLTCRASQMIVLLFILPELTTRFRCCTVTVRTMSQRCPRDDRRSTNKGKRARRFLWRRQCQVTLVGGQRQSHHRHHQSVTNPQRFVRAGVLHHQAFYQTCWDRSRLLGGSPAATHLTAPL